MRQKKLKAWLLAVAVMLLMPFGAEAAGLGRMNVLSYLGQPLNAEIELVSVQRNETVNARIGMPDAYAQANLTYNAALAGARITSQQRPNGDLFLRVTTSRPVTEPFLELLVELNTQHGRVTRQYTALLDPAGYGRAAAELPPPVTPPVAGAPAPAPAPAAAAPAPAAAAPAPAAAAPAQDPSAMSGAPAVTPGPAAAPPPAAGGRGRRDRAVPPPPSGAASEYGPIKRGETLGRIARSVKPEGVTLEQTLVGLYRDNPDAFIKKNMNLVKSGKILRVPDATAIAAVAPKEASQEVRLQTADFNAFRGRLADRAGEAREEGSVTSGRIGSRVADRAAAEGPKDTLRVSRGEPGGKGKGSPRNAAERVRALEEEAVAREIALVEANDRIEKLEKTIKDMQKLAELKSPGMAAAQQAAEKGKAPAAPSAKKGEEAAVIAAAPKAAAPVPGSDPAAKGSTPAPPATPDAGKRAAAPPAATPDAAKAEAPKAEPPKAAPAATAKAAPPPPAPDYVEMIMSDPLYMATAAGVVLGLGGFAFWAVRRRRSGRDDGDGLVKIAPTLSGGASAKALPKEATAAAATTGSPVGTAAAAMPDARRAEPQPAAPRKAPEPKTAAAPAPAPAPTAPTAARPSAGATPADDNDLDFGAKTPSGPWPAAPPAQPAPAPRPAPQTAAPRPPPPPAPAPQAAAPRPPPPPAPAPQAAAPRPMPPPAPAPAAERPSPPPAREEKPLPIVPDFELDATPPAKPAQGGARTIDSNVIDFSLDPLPPVGSPDLPTIDTPSPSQAAGPAASSSPPDLTFDLNALDLELGKQRTAAGAARDEPPRDEHWYDVQQKFDLAKAYEEMGDKDGARDILKEVLKEGDAEQQAQAQKLLGTVG